MQSSYMYTGNLKPFFFVWSIFTITFALWHGGKIPTQFISKGVPSGGGGVTPLTFLKFVGILTKCVGKISWPNVVGKFGVFYHKKRNAEFYQYPVPQKSNCYRRWWRLKMLREVCTNEYDNGEYLVDKYIRFFTNDIIWCL